MAELDKLELIFTEDRKTIKTVLFEEELGEQSYSRKDLAVQYLYVQKEALEMIGNPGRLKVTIEPYKGD